MQLIETAPILLFAVDSELRYTYINPFFSQLHSVGKESAIGLNIADVIGEDGFNSNLKHYEAALSGLVVHYESHFVKLDGTSHYYRAIYTPIKIKGYIQGFTGVVMDITAEKELERLSKTDSLTNLGNRRDFEGRLKTLIDNKVDSIHGLIFIDIDYFKDVNDQFGHDVGDKALVALAKLLKDTNRLSSSSFRIGGEEFSMIFPDIKGSKELLSVANKIRLAIESTTLITEKPITVSIGATLFEYNFDRLDILKKADNALYASKNKGRNQVSICIDPSPIL